ncbi:MAG: DUF4405 domain-containing protein [Clostridia bacterium]|nr:DUF4405 domain-containing protein [Clostridia bacterium]
MKNKVYRMIVDILMFIFMLLEYSKIYTGQLIHEILGIALLILFIIHNILNINFYKNIFKGKYNSSRAFLTIVDIGFLIFMALTIILGVPISKELFNFFSIANGSIISKLHILFSYWGMLFLAMHIGLHIKTIFAKLICKVKKNNFLKYVVILLQILIVIYGIKLFFNTNIINYIIAKSSFGNYTKNIWISLWNNFMIIFAIAIIIYNFERIINLNNKGKKE